MIGKKGSRLGSLKIRGICLHCRGEMRLIGFVNEGADIKKILDHIGEPSVPPKLSPDVQFDQSVNW